MNTNQNKKIRAFRVDSRLIDLNLRLSAKICAELPPPHSLQLPIGFTFGNAQLFRHDLQSSIFIDASLAHNLLNARCNIFLCYHSRPRAFPEPSLRSAFPSRRSNCPRTSPPLPP